MEDKVIFKEESFQIIGCCFDVFNELGYGLREKNYQKAIENALAQKGLKFQSQLYVPLKMGEKVIGRYYIDLFIEDKIAIELKVGNHFLRKDIEQLLSYLKSKNLQLGILINFTPNGVEFKRILNL